MSRLELGYGSLHVVLFRGACNLFAQALQVGDVGCVQLGSLSVVQDGILSLGFFGQDAASQALF